MSPPIDVYLLTGYLGAGKTTLLNHLLDLPQIAGRPTALIVNEFGGLGIDGRLIHRGERALFELNRGSVFCICLQSDFLKTLEEIQKLNVDLVLVEATGAAETSDLQSFFRAPAIQGRFAVRANLCLVDALNVTKVLPFMRAAGSQIRQADGLVVNKSDRIDAEQLARLQSLLATFNPRAPQTTVSFGRIDWDFLASLEPLPKMELLIADPPPEVIVCSFADYRADPERLLETIDALGENLLRFKGIFPSGAGFEVIESVLGHIDRRRFDSPGASVGATAIAYRMSQSQLREALERALAPA